MMEGIVETGEETIRPRIIDTAEYVKAVSPFRKDSS